MNTICFHTVYPLALLHMAVFTYGATLGSLTCSPTEEGKESYVTLTWNSAISMSVNKGKNSVLMCQASRQCSVLQPFPHTTISIHSQVKDYKVKGQSKLTIKIHNATRNGENPTSGYWTLSYFGHNPSINTTCLVYETIENVECSSTVLQDRLQIKCSSYRTYPEIKCNFWVNQPLKDNYVNIQYNDEISNITTQMIRTCTSDIVFLELTSNKIIVNVTMHRNVTYSEADARYETSKSIIFDFETDALSCSPAVEGSRGALQMRWNIKWPVTLYKDDSLVFSCDSNTKCELHKSVIMDTSYKADGDKIDVELSVLNVTRHGRNSTAGRWKMDYLGLTRSLLTTCEVMSVPHMTLNGCPARVERGSNVRCLCTSSLKSAKTAWFINETNQFMSNDLLSFTAQHYTVFRCQSAKQETYFGVHQIYRPEITYQPIVRDLRGSISNGSSDNSTLSLFCNDTTSVLTRRNKTVVWVSTDHFSPVDKNRSDCRDYGFYECVLTDSSSHNVQSVTILCSDRSINSYSIKTGSDGNINLEFLIAVISSSVSGFLIILLICIVIFCIRKRKDADSDEIEISYQSGSKLEETFYKNYELPTESARNSVYVQYL